jgi:hypothetical protein
MGVVEAPQEGTKLSFLVWDGDAKYPSQARKIMTTYLQFETKEEKKQTFGSG